MPQGKVIAVKPGLDENSCEGEVEALESDKGTRIKEGVTYEFKNGSGTCCKKKRGDLVTIINLLPDGTIIIQC